MDPLQAATPYKMNRLMRRRRRLPQNGTRPRHDDRSPADHQDCGTCRPTPPLPPLGSARTAVARRRAAVSAQLALHHRDRRLSRAGAAGLPARLFQLERPDPRDRRHPSVRAVRHQPLLPPAAHPSRPEMPEMAGARDGGDRDVLPAGNPGALGRDPSPPSSIRRRAAGPAQPAGQFLLEPHRLDPGASAGAVAARHLRTLRQGHPARPLLRRARTPYWLVWINLIQMPLFFAAGFAVAWLFGANAGRGGADRARAF